MRFLSWHYSQGLKYYLDSWMSSISLTSHFFSPQLLLSTLFDPWKRLVVSDKTPGFNLQKKIESITFNLISRGMGATVRFCLFWIAIVLVLGVFFVGVVGLLFWLLIPPLGYPAYSRSVRQPKNFVRSLLLEAKVGTKDPLRVILKSEAGSFVLSHLGIDLEDALAGANKDKMTLDIPEADNFEKLMSFVLKRGVWNDDFFSKKAITKEDFILSAFWWDRKKREETGMDEASFSRPGIALELTFGYTPTLNQYSVDLATPQSFFHRLIGRGEIVSRMARILVSGQSLVLIGEPGVGKKTTVLEFAKKASAGELGREMSFKRVLEFDYNSLLAKATDVNQKKNELSQILAEAESAGNIILMIKDIQRLTHPDIEGYDFTDTFESHLEKRRLKIIAVSTNTDYERFISLNSRLRKYLEKVEIIPPSKKEVILILIDAAKRWESLTGFTITVPTLRYILEQSDQYITEVPFPEKSLEILDAVVTYKKERGGNVIEVVDANNVLAEKTGISFARLGEEEKDKLRNIEGLIHKRLINQDIAVSLIGKALRSKTVGVVKEGRPLGSFLFLGPTGVGKTETAKVLAKVYYGSEENILRFDMAEYSGAQGLERLIGSVEKNIPGSLTTAIKNRPASILLLDEIEKASKEIYNLFLSLLDEGVITDAYGKKIICRNLFVIGTSNAGAEYIRQLVEGGSEDLQKLVVNHVLEAEIFSPEFLNRFDGVVVYESLKEEDLAEIARLMLSDLAENLKKRNIKLKVTDEAVQRLAQDGYDPAFGARPMRRIVNLTLGDLLGQAILKEELKEGDTVSIIPGRKKEEYFFKKD